METDRVAIVTGAARGIGFATAQRLAEAGIKVALIDRSPSVVEQGERLQKSGHTAIGIIGDVSTENSVMEFVAQVQKTFGPISILVNNAGLTLVHRNWKSVTPEQWDEVMTRAVVSDMEKQKWGRIINISSVTFLSGQRNLIDYVSAKGGVVGFSRTLAREVGSDFITVNTVTPGAIRTEAEIEMVPDAQDVALAPIMEVQAIKRRGTPDDVAAAIAFLCNDDAGFITGQNLVVDGGWMLN
jgi:3-oxoacyl-[acyl-carrier protein] reductase